MPTRPFDAAPDPAVGETQAASRDVHPQFIETAPPSTTMLVSRTLQSITTRSLAAPVTVTLAVTLWLVLAGVGIGSYPLVEPDEGRNAEAAREISAGGSWLHPRYDGLPLLDKPLLWFDLAAVAMRVTGGGELAARLPSLIATLVTALLVGWFAGRRLGRTATRVAALAAATSPLALAFARLAIFDALLALLVTLAMVAGFLAVEEAAAGRRWALLAWVAVALGILTKGPVALVLPLLVLVPYGVWRRRLTRLWSLPGALALLGLVLPWLLATERAVPGFLRYALLTETWGRLTSDELDRDGPLWYFLPYLLAGSLPWSAATLGAWWRRRDPALPSRRHEGVFLLLWLLLPLLFFSLSESKRPQYLLPLLPALVLLLACRLDEPEAVRRATRAGGAMLLAWAAVLGLAAAAVPYVRRLPAELAAPAQSTALALAATAALGGAVALRRPVRRTALVALALVPLLLPLSALPLLVRIAEERSSRELAATIADGCPGAAVIGLETLPTSLPFYLGRPVGLISATGRQFPSTFVSRHWRDLGWLRRAGKGTPLLSTARSDLPAEAVVLVARADSANAFWAENAGFAPLGGDRHHTAFGRGCGRPPIAGAR